MSSQRTPYGPEDVDCLGGRRRATQDGRSRARMNTYEVEALQADAAATRSGTHSRRVHRTCPRPPDHAVRSEIWRAALGDGRTFGVVFRSRYNHTLRRDDVVRSLAEVVAEKNAAHRVDLANPQLAVVVEVVANVCCLSVLTDYARFRKYNLSELYGETRRRQADEAPSDAGKAESGERKDAEDAGKALGEGRDGEAAGDAGTGQDRDGNEAGEGRKNMEAEEGGENMEAGGDASPNDCGDENGEAVDEALVVTTKLDAGDGMLREICDEEKSKSVDETLVISNNAVKLDAKDETLGKNCDKEKSESANETLATDTVT
ncbi:PREDICTED: THUMP domain-containing protein 1-like [Priapulus caudatus]|uniref:THUMP domain-containing protein 1-like n=1 Tax=Priapulus caudatus TaxID=37621 RepID=A0ABM1DRE4_PRICU|nr:PREDICTED: THUMP domain-containing protein 1-like [Priapulus caudatus]